MAEVKTEVKRKLGRPSLGHKQVGVFLDDTACERLERFSANAGITKSEYVARLLTLASALDKAIMIEGSKDVSVSQECEDLFFKYSEEIQAYFGIGKVPEEQRKIAREKFAEWQQRGRNLGREVRRKAQEAKAKNT